MRSYWDKSHLCEDMASQRTCPFPSYFQLQPENWKLDEVSGFRTQGKGGETGVVRKS